MPEKVDLEKIYETAKDHAGTEEQRRYWRERQREHRIKKASLKEAASFKANLTRFERCSFCGEWHPTEAILRDGTFARFSLDSFHSKESILNWVRGLEAGLPKTAAFIDHEHATALCIKQLMDETGLSEDVARKEAETLIRNDAYRNKFIKLHHDAAVLEHIRDRRLKMCMIGRMEMYKESEHIARANCMIIFEDPLYRHFPPGLVKDPQGHYDLVGPVLVPVQIDKAPWLSKNPTIQALRECFTDKMKKNPDLDPATAMQQCMNELESKGYGEPEKPVVGDLFGKSPAEIRAMSKKKPDPTLTVGDLYGLTRKQRLRMQRHGWDEEDNEAFEQCVREKMEKEHMTRKEAEETCEGLNAKSGEDRKLPAADNIAGQIHVS